jgi:hypothetical protein
VDPVAGAIRVTDEGGAGHRVHQIVPVQPEQC